MWCCVLIFWCTEWYVPLFSTLLETCWRVYFLSQKNFQIVVSEFFLILTDFRFMCNFVILTCLADKITTSLSGEHQLMSSLGIFSLRHFGHFLLRHFGHWNISVLTVVLKPTIAVFISLYFQTFFWNDWKHFGLWL